jgi:NAD(P)-dependent dehydrogenase (short-subunit alcohol dehydrogenase family)
MDLLKKADSSRVVNVSSEAHKGGRFEPDNIQLTDGYNGLQAYANTKLFNIMFSRELADKVQGTGITTYSLHPGTVRTNLDSGGGGGTLFAFLFKLAKPFMMSPKKGARTSVYLATEPGIESLSGKYFVNNKVAEPLEIAHDKEKCRQLWEISETLTIKRT